MLQKKNLPRDSGRQEREIYKLGGRGNPSQKKEGLKVFLLQIRPKLATLKRAEWIQKHRNRRQRKRTRFFQDPFKYAWSLLGEKESRNLAIP